MEIDINELRKRSLFVATPMYGGNCTGFFTKSITDLAIRCNTLGIPFKFFTLMNESLIARARNYCTDEFLRSECSHMMFIDADICFHYDDVLALLWLAEENSDKDIICGAYPKKNISWEKVKKAVDKGLADENPSALSQYTGDYVFNVSEAGNYSLDAPIPVSEAGTGFMLIKKSVFETFDKNHPELLYYPDHKRNENFDGKRQIMAYFMDQIYEGRHLSEDYMFCKMARDLGLKVWICPWMSLHHIGTYMFEGNLVKTLQAGLAATLDPNDKI